MKHPAAVLERSGTDAEGGNATITCRCRYRSLALKHSTKPRMALRGCAAAATAIMPWHFLQAWKTDHHLGNANLTRVEVVPAAQQVQDKAQPWAAANIASNTQQERSGFQ